MKWLPPRTNVDVRRDGRGTTLGMNSRDCQRGWCRQDVVRLRDGRVRHYVVGAVVPAIGDGPEVPR